MYFVNLPKLKTYNAACLFICNITKQLWKNEFFGKYYNDLNVCLFTEDYDKYQNSAILYNTYQHPQLTITINELVDLIHMFFTNHNPFAIREALSKNNSELFNTIYGGLSYT